MTELSNKQQAFLDMLLKGNVQLEDKSQDKIPVRKIHSPVPLSFSQQRLWFLDRLVPGNPFYNLPFAFQLSGKIDIPILEQSVNEIIRHHESLRTIFSIDDENEEPVQVILPELKIKIQFIDLCGLSTPEQQEETLRLTSEDASKPFDLARGPLLRMSLLKLGDDEYVLSFTLHHIIFDGWSMRVFIRELDSHYIAFSMGKSSLPGPLLQYADFALWQRQRMQGEILEKQLPYWEKMLSGELPILELPTDHQRPAVSTYQGGFQTIQLPGNLIHKLTQLHRQEACSMFMVLLTAFFVLLYRYCGQEDILVGSPIANRNRKELEGMIGFFANTLVFRCDLSGNPGFRELLERVGRVTAGAYDNQDVPFEKLVKEFQPHRYMNHTPLFQVMFNFERMHAPAGEEEKPGKGNSSRLNIKKLAVHNKTSKFDLWLNMYPTGEKMQCEMEYGTDILTDATITRLFGHFKTLLESIVEQPGLRIHDLPLLPKEEKTRILSQWNDTRREYEIQCLQHSFEAQVERTPEHMALVGQIPNPKSQIPNKGKSFGQILNAFGMMHLTYRELNEKTDQLACLLKEKGVQPDVIVGIMAERSVEMVIGLLGILKAGGAYLPLDPEYPVERIDYMLKDQKVRILVKSSNIIRDFIIGDDIEVISIDEVIGKNRPKGTTSHLHLPPAPVTSLAYVIYTSGSTGSPKGSAVPHKGISNRLHWMQEVFRLTADDRVLQKTPFSFDVSVWEFFWPLLSGAGLVMAEPGGHKDSAYLVKVINRERITTIHFVPTMLNVFLEDPGIHRITTLKRVICSGEALPMAYRELFFKSFPAAVQLYNLYGPTEASVDVTAWACERQSQRNTVPLGRPIANTQIYILDRYLKPVPIGVHGELHIGGIQLARGYLNHPQLTAEKFINNALSSWLLALRRTGRATNAFRGHNQPGAFQEISRARGQELKPNPPTLRAKSKELRAKSQELRAKSQELRAKLYKTGDLVRWLPDGNIEFLGRLDFQVKVRGFRIELGEIESKLRSHDYLEDAVVMTAKMVHRPGENKLIAYITLKPGYLTRFNKKSRIKGSERAGQQPFSNHVNNPLLAKAAAELVPGLKNFLKDELPEYMVPAYFILLENLPFTNNGKLDRQALSRHESLAMTIASQQEKRMAKPRTPLEKLYAKTWQDVLLIDEVGLDDNFFQLGGDSIDAIQVISKINKNGFKLSVSHLYRNMTIAQLVNYVDQHREELTLTEKAPDVLMDMGLKIDKKEILDHLPPGTEIEDIYPLTPLQKHMLFHDLNNPFNANEPALFLNQAAIPMHLESSAIPLIEKAFRKFVEVYPYLRTALWWEHGEPYVQVVYKQVQAEFKYLDLSHLSTVKREKRVKDLIKADHCRGFERNKPNVVRISIIRLLGNECLLLQTSDLMRVDGWSTMIVRKKFSEYTQALPGDQTPELESNASYKEYISWLSRQDESQGEDYWRRMIRGCPVPTPLVARAPQNIPAKRKTKGFSIQPFYFSLEETAQIDEFLKQHQLVLSALGCGIWSFLLSYYTSHESVLLGMLFSGRGSALPGIETMIGQTMNILPIRVNISRAKPILDLLKEILDTLVEINQYDFYQQDKIRELWEIPQEIPLFESYFVLENFPGVKESKRDALLSRESTREHGSRYISQMEYPLRVELFPHQELWLTMHYHRRCFTDAAIKAMLKDFRTLLLGIIANPYQRVEELSQLLGNSETGGSASSPQPAMKKNDH